jgi:Sulfotransferase domain
MHAISDMPAIVFVDELLAAYPDAKVILATRVIDSWLASFSNSVYVVLEARLNRFHEVFPPKGPGAAFAFTRRVVTIRTGGDSRTVISCAEDS